MMEKLTQLAKHSALGYLGLSLPAVFATRYLVNGVATPVLLCCFLVVCCWSYQNGKHLYELTPQQARVFVTIPTSLYVCLWLAYVLPTADHALLYNLIPPYILLLLYISAPAWLGRKKQSSPRLRVFAFAAIGLFFILDIVIAFTR